MEFRKVTYLVPTAGRGAELLRRLGPFLASISSFRGLLWDSLCPERERENGGFPVSRVISLAL